jgi:type IV pilus assembly protein PilC
MVQQKKIQKEYLFEYTGKDIKGKEVSGEIRSVSESVAKVSLKGRQIKVTKIKKKGNGLFGKGKVKQADIAILTRQLSTMMKSGVPLIQSFDIVANSSSKPAVAKLVNEIKLDIETGSSLEQAFARHPQYFDKLYCNLIAAGEAAGILDDILNRLALYQEKITAIKKKIKSALTYPIAVLGITAIVTAILMIFVVPSFKNMFESFGADLPVPTKVIMGISEVFVSYWWLMLLGIGVLGYAIKVAFRYEKVKNIWDRVILKFPIFGKVIQKSIYARWARTLSTMFATGVPLVESLNSVAGASGNIIYYNATKNIQKEIATGTGLTAAMIMQKVFPPMMLQMSQIGEESGSLDDMLDKVASFYEEEVDVAVASLSSLMEPLIIAFLGVIVGGLVISMYLPIFKMASVI